MCTQRNPKPGINKYERKEMESGITQGKKEGGDGLVEKNLTDVDRLQCILSKRIRLGAERTRAVAAQHMDSTCKFPTSCEGMSCYIFDITARK